MSRGVARPGPRERAVDLSAREWVLTVAQILWISIKLAGTAIRRLLSRKRSDDLDFAQYMGYAGVRYFQNRLSPARIQNLVDPTAKSCKRFAKQHGISHVVIQLVDGTVAHWLGPPDAKRHVVFCHGGGYVAPALYTHVEFAFGFAAPPPHDVAVIVLAYSLSLENANKYPCQLRQAASLLDHLLSQRHISPSSIVLLGDSAGAHVLIGLLLHLKHPNPQVPPVEVEGVFAGAAFVSPWLKVHAPAKSIKSSGMDDVVEPQALAFWASLYLGGAPSDPWNDPLTAPRDWWTHLPVNDVFIAYGKDELLRGGCAEFAEIMQAVHPSTSVCSAAKEVHDHMVLNRFLSLNRPCETADAYVQWMEQHFTKTAKDESSIQAVSESTPA